MKKTIAPLAVALAVAVTGGCSKKEESASPAPSSHGADAEPAATAPPPVAASAPASAAAPSASAATPPHDCPKGSSGEATFAKPCDAKGSARMMDVVWTGKTDDKGPYFRVTNKSPSVILYGKTFVYFYDKGGKQLEIKDASVTPPKARPSHTCSGNMFGGVMKPGEKAVMTFSCVKKEHVPDGTASIEAEMQMVGFADSSEKKVEYYWRNADLVPDARPKGGVK